MEQEFLCPEDAATIIGMSTAYLAKLRRNSSGPPFVKVGPTPRGDIRYQRVAFMAWWEAMKVTPATRNVFEANSYQPSNGNGNGKTSKKKR